MDTQKKICKKCNCIESDINKFEKIRHSCNKCRYQAKTRNIEYFKQYYQNNQ